MQSIHLIPLTPLSRFPERPQRKEWRRRFGGGGLLVQYARKNPTPCCKGKRPAKAPSPSSTMLKAVVTSCGLWTSWHGGSDRCSLQCGCFARQWTNVHGVDEYVFTQASLAGHCHRTWSNRKGEAVVELCLIDGMGMARRCAGRGHRPAREAPSASCWMWACRRRCIWRNRGALFAAREPAARCERHVASAQQRSRR